MKNYLTFDLEKWYDSEFISQKSGDDCVLNGLERVEAILNKYNTKATFFVTGKVLENYPEIVKNLHERGHEIGSHSYEHKMFSKLSEEEIESQLKHSKKLIEKTIGLQPKGFRAPSFSITEENAPEIYKQLDKLGFNYSSSLFPVNMGLFGSANFPKDPFKPLNGKNLIELPIRPFEFLNLRIPFSNGFPFRLLPRQIIKHFIKRLNKKGKPVILALHPWEFCPEIPRVKTSVLGKIITYWGLKWNKSKLNYILSNFEFIPICEAIKDARI